MKPQTALMACVVAVISQSALPGGGPPSQTVPVRFILHVFPGDLQPTQNLSFGVRITIIAGEARPYVGSFPFCIWGLKSRTQPNCHFEVRSGPPSHTDMADIYLPSGRAVSYAFYSMPGGRCAVEMQSSIFARGTLVVGRGVRKDARWCYRKHSLPHCGPGFGDGGSHVSLGTYHPKMHK